MRRTESQSNSSRRALLGAGAAGLFTTIMTGRIVQGQITTTPTATEGPFWEDLGLNRSDITEAQAGLPLLLMVSVSQLVGGVARPLSNAQLDIWQCNAVGWYSDEPAGMGNPNTLGQRWLRGFQMTSARGLARFTSIYPGYYVGRTTHIHARVRTYNGTATTRNITTQFFFDDSVSDFVYTRFAPYNTLQPRGTRNNNDGIFNTQSGGSTIGNRLMLRLANGGTAAIASFNIVVT